MLKFLSNKLSSLRRRSFTFLAVTSRAFNYFFLWHRNTLLTKMRLNGFRRNRSVKPRGHGIKSILPGSQDFCDAVLALIQDVLNLIYPTAAFATDSLQSIFGALRQPLASVLA